MKKLILILLTTVLITSCQFKEEVSFNKDGSGTFNLAIDMSGMLSMAKGMDKDSTKTEKRPVVKDSIIRFVDLIKDKKAYDKLSDEEKTLINKMKNLVIRMYVDEANDKMEMTYILPFEKTKDLDDFFENIKKIDKINKNKKDPMADMSKDLPNDKVRYHFSKRKFHREVIVAKKEKKNDTTANDSDKKFEQMLNMFQYEIVYHFPYKIKKVSYAEEALLSTDGKTLHIKVPMQKMMDDPKLLDFEVEFE